MNRFLVLLSMFAAFVGFMPSTASAQAYGTCAYTRDAYGAGRWIGPGCGAPVGIPSNQLVPMPSYGPGYYQNNGGLVRCSAPLVGALAGGTLGSFAKHHTGQAMILGAIAGGVVANELFCQRVNIAPPVAAAPATPYYDRGYANSAPVSGGTRCTVRSVVDGSVIRKTINVMSPSDCEALSGFVEDAKQQAVATNERTEEADGNVSSQQKYKLEETSRPSGSERSNCVLRVRGKVVAEQEVPESEKDDAKSFCDRWQRKEAHERGLI